VTAKIIITDGPEAGREIQLPAGPVRIGTGPHAEVQLNDPALQGDLRLDIVDGAVVVVNLLPTAIYLNEQPLAPQERRVWFDETDLQPTAMTKLRLTRGTARPSSSLPFAQVLLTLLLILMVLMGLSLLDASGPRVPAPKSLSAMQGELEAMERTTTTSQGASPLLRDARWVELREQLTLGRRAAMAQQERRAAESYRLVVTRCRELKAAPPPNMPDTFDLLLTELIRTMNAELISIGQLRGDD
jgi:hypothetical protein